MDNFQRVLDILQAKPLTEAVEMTEGDKIYLKAKGGFTKDVLKKASIDAETMKTVNAICLCKDGDVKITSDVKGLSGWDDYDTSNHKKAKKDTGKSNYDGDDYVAKRLRDRRGK